MFQFFIIIISLLTTTALFSAGESQNIKTEQAPLISQPNCCEEGFLDGRCGCTHSITGTPLDPCCQSPGAKIFCFPCWFFCPSAQVEQNDSKDTDFLCEGDYCWILGILPIHTNCLLCGLGKCI